MKIEVEEKFYDNTQDYKGNYFYYLRFYYSSIHNKVTFKVTKMPDIHFKSHWKEFDIIDTKSKRAITDNDFMFSQNRMIILTESNIDYAKRLILDKFHDSLDNRIKSIKNLIKSHEKDIENIKKIQNSSIFRYKKIEKVLKTT